MRPWHSRLAWFAVLMLFATVPVFAQINPEFEPPEFKPVVYTFTATLSGNQVVPPVDTPASGIVIAVLVDNQLTVTGEYRDLSRQLLRAGVGSAPPGETGQWVTLKAEQDVWSAPGSMILTATHGTSGTFSGVFTLTDEQRVALGDGRYYVQLTTVNHRDGELRAQLHSEFDFGFDAEDLVGIWRAGSSYVQYFPDGTARVAGSLKGLETNPSMTGTWTLEGHILTWVRGENEQGCEVGDVDVFYLDGLVDDQRRARELEIECTGGGRNWLYFMRVTE